MKALRSIKTGVESSLQEQEAMLWMERTAEVKRWMQNVDTLDKEVEGFLESFNNMVAKGCFREWCSCWSKYKLSKMAISMAEQVRKLKDQREKIGDNLVHLWPREAVEELPTSTSSVVGSEEILNEVQSLINDDNIGIIGMCGMGGVGKTSLLKKLNNQILATGSKDVDIFIWVTVSKDLRIPQIQKDVENRLGLSFANDTLDSLSQIEERARTILAVLSKKRFLIFLDDIWTKLALLTVGFPLPNYQNRSKVVLTARSEEVCIDMDARVVKVHGLGEKRSWDLFCQKLGVEVDVNSPTIRPYAEEVVVQCSGLPLALITVGQAMANKRDPGEWRYAAKMLQVSPGEVRGMVDVFSLLKFSFDPLESEALRSYLMYCSLFPEDSDIDMSRLVNYYIGEGLVGDYSHQSSLVDLRYKARGLIRRLQAACLLEVDQTGYRSVRMHDSIRDMALWLTGAGGDGGASGGGPGSSTNVLGRRKEIFVVHTAERKNDVLPVGE